MSDYLIVSKIQEVYEKLEVLSRETHARLARVEHGITDLRAQMEKMMSQISDYAAAVGTSFDAIEKAVTDIGTEIQALQDQIAQLQNSPGAVTAEDQALLDGIQTRAASIASMVTAMDTTPPAPAPDPAPAPVGEKHKK